MTKDTRSVAEYENDIKVVRNRIRKMREDAEHHGGGIVDLQLHEYDLQKKKIFAKATHMAKEQKQESVVERMIKSARKVSLFQKMEISDNIVGMGAGTFWSSVIASAGVYMAAPVVTACGTAALLGTVAYCIYKDDKLVQSQKDMTALKEYVKSGDLKTAVKVAEKTEKPSLKSRIIAKFKDAYSLK